MKIEHLTLGGTPVVRDTTGILPTTAAYFRFLSELGPGRHLNLALPDTPFSLNVSIADDGTMFDLCKGGDIALLNVCCFSHRHGPVLMDMIRGLVGKIPYLPSPPAPRLAMWLYTIPINPFALSPAELSLVGEIELYIYHALIPSK